MRRLALLLSLASLVFAPAAVAKPKKLSMKQARAAVARYSATQPTADRFVIRRCWRVSRVDVDCVVRWYGWDFYADLGYPGYGWDQGEVSVEKVGRRLHVWEEFFGYGSGVWYL